MLELSLFTLASSDPTHHVVDQYWFGKMFTQHVAFGLIAALLTVTILPLAVRRITADGTGGRFGGFFEVILLFIRDEVSRPFLGKEGDKYLWVIWSFFFFILFNNLLGMIPVVGRTPTGNISFTAGLAIVAFCFYNGVGIKKHGLIKYLRSSFLVGPWPLWPMMIIIEGAGIVVKPFALAVRLFANMVAGHVMLSVILGFGAAGLLIGTVSSTAAVALTFLELLVSFVQAFIFTFLTTVFLSMAVHPDH